MPRRQTCVPVVGLSSCSLAKEINDLDEHARTHPHSPLTHQQNRLVLPWQHQHLQVNSDPASPARADLLPRSTDCGDSVSLTLVSLRSPGTTYDSLNRVHG